MRNIILIIAFLLLGVTTFAQNKEGSIGKDRTYNDFSFTAADTINESETYYIEVSNFQSNPQMQDVWIDIDSASGDPNVTITVYGKKFEDDTYASIGTAVTWAGTSSDTAFNYTVATANRYRYLKIEFAASATDQQSLISDVIVKTWNTGGQLTSTSITDGTATITSGAGSGFTTFDMSGALTVGGTTTLDDAIGQTITQSSNDYGWLGFLQWNSGADMAAGGSYGLYSRANVGHTVQNVIGGKSAIKFLTLAADESINYGSGFEATLELDEVTTHTLTVTDHVSALNLYFDGSNKVEGVGGGAYSKMNLSRAMWNSTENFSIETNGYQLETANGSFLDYGINIYNDGTMLSGLWIHNNPAGGTIANDITLQNGEVINNATDGVTNLGNSNIRGATWNFCDATGVGGTAASAVALDYTPDLPALQAGLMIMFVAEGANTTTLTIAVDGGTAKNVYEQAPGAAPSALEGSEINTGSVVMAVYDGTQWVLVSPTGN